MGIMVYAFIWVMQDLSEIYLISRIEGLRLIGLVGLGVFWNLGLRFRVQTGLAGFRV